MYLYIGFFSHDEVNRRIKYIPEKGVNIIKNAFANFLELNNADIKAAIGYFLGKGNGEKSCFLLDVNSIEASEKRIIITFDNIREFDKSSGDISKEIYKKAWELDWIDRETNYCPLVLILDKQTFDSIRKGSANIKKLSDLEEQVQALKAKNKWGEICKLYEPLEDIHKNPELWDNPNKLYEIGFACSKMGELQDGLEKDSDHLKEIKRYRDLSLKFYKRCCELRPKSYKYASSVAYRYYQNVNELTKTRGKRKDGDVREEVENAHKWFDISLNLYPNNIKDNYRKGKLIVDKQLAPARNTGNRLSKEDLQEIENLKNQAIKHLDRAIQSYEGLTDEDRKNFYRNEYIKSLYNLAKLYKDEVNTNWNQYLCCKIGDKKFLPAFLKSEYLDASIELVKKCYRVVTGFGIDDELDIGHLFSMTNKATIKPIDLLYSLGLLYSRIYFINHIQNKNENIKAYRHYAYKFLNRAMDLRNEFSRRGMKLRNTDYINNCLAKLNIIEDKYTEAIRNTRMSRRSYVRNTYAAALMLTGDKNNIRESMKILEAIVKDRHNLSRSLSIALLAKAYQLMGYDKDKERLIKDNNSTSVQRLLEFIM